MTRGSNRRDVPTSGVGWIDYSCPAETWEYWEGKDKFAREISPALRIDIAKNLSYFRDYHNDWKAEKKDRWDMKRIMRGLKAAEKTGMCPDSKLQRFVEVHCLDLLEKTLADKVRYLLQEIADKPEDFTMERPLPKPLYTRILYDLFSDNGFNDLLGSTNARYALSKETRDDDPLETAFIEFVRLCIWKDDPKVTRSVKFCNRVSKAIQERPVRRRP